MKAVRFHSYGGTEALRYEDAPEPLVTPNDVLIRVHATGVNPADIQFRRGDYQAFAPLPLPFILGWDVSGTVAAVGANVKRYQPGDAVFAMTNMSRNGSYAELVSVSADEVASAPKTLPLEHAAGVPLAALTAWAALFDLGKLSKGQSVLIHAGAGGVGLFAIQLARRAGAHVVTTASTANHPLLISLGANDVIDYGKSDFASNLKNIDVVLDTVGGETRARSWPLLRENGILVGIAMPPPDITTADTYKVRTAMTQVTPNGTRLAEIGKLIDAGTLKVVIDREFPLADAAAAHRRIEQGHVCGKIILRVS